MVRPRVASRPLSFETRQKISLAMRGENNPSKRPEIRKKLSILAKRRNSIQHLQRKNNGSSWNKGKRPNALYRQRLSEALKGRSYVELFGEKEARRLKRMRTKQILSQKNEFPNKFEFDVLSFLNNSGNIKFTYCGDGSVLIGDRSPDFINRKNRILVLAEGVYFHLIQKGLEINSKNKRLREKIEASPFLKAGYSVWFIWEDEFREWEKSVLFGAEAALKRVPTSFVKTKLPRLRTFNFRKGVGI